MEKSELTICSVYYSTKTARQLEENLGLTRGLNPGVETKWLIGNNSPREFPVELDGGEFLVVDGVRDGEVPKFPWRGSMQHSLALKKLLPQVKTRFVLILDPDFYIVRPNWVREVTSRMKNLNLSFFGSVWHPRYYTKYRYFPTVHCFFADLKKVSVRELDFRPVPQDAPEFKIAILKTHLPKIIKRIVLALTFQNRRFIGDSRDTGYAVYKKFFGREGMRYELLQPVFRPWRDRDWLARVLYLPNRLLEIFLPDRLCFTPKRQGYYSSIAFRDFGFFSARDRGWEEYLWQNRPFGIHLRGTKSGQRGLKNGFAEFLPV